MKKIRQDIVENKKTVDEDYIELTPERRQQLDWFQDQKIGVLFHWGLYSQAGIVESWQLSKEDTWARKKPWRDNLNDLRHDYWHLAQTFNPQHFNPDTWADEAVNAGFKYALFTTKHHDGFNMYNTKQTDFSVTHFTGKDLFGDFANSFNQHGIHVGAYYSKPDWHSPYYWQPGSDPIGRYASYDPLDDPATWSKFNQFVQKQLLEISQNYGDIDILWLDGGWVNSEHHEFLDMETTIGKMRQQQPQMLVVDRSIGGKFEDYVTPERKVPDQVPRKCWESNIPLAKNWGFVPNDIYKPFDEILTTMLEIVSLGGNIILGVGPKPDGTLPAEALAIMHQLGAWLKTYGDGIYGTRAIPRLKQANWYFTAKDKQLYAFAKREVFNPEDLQLGPLTEHVTKQQLIPTEHADDLVLAVKLTLDQPVKQIMK